MVTIDYTGLRLTGALCINRLTTLELHVGVNEHGWAVVEGEAGENALEQLQGAVAGREQVIMVRDETSAEQPLFAGVIRSAGLITYGGYNRFRIELQSGTIQMDQVKRSRSFQDVAQTYSQVAQRVASGYEDGAVIPTVGLDKPLEVPVIQYRETDWEFLKRMASWCGGVVVPETHYAYPRIWFGFPDRAFTCTFPEDCYTSGISQRYYELGGPAAGNRRADFFYYDVPSSQMCDLGWYTVFRGQEFLICEKWAKLERGELLFTYRLGKPGLGYGRKEYNDKISGMTILGEVLSTKRETVCLKLDIDQGWAPGGPYPYTWRPETGNMMYCMPQVGTRVSLYFPNYDEQAAIAVNCVRTNGSSCARMSDPSRRSFVTEHGKEMNLYPQELSFLGGANGTVKLEDETGITISTDKKIRIIAKQSVLVNGKTLAVAAPAGELVLAKGNALSGSIESSVIQSSQYDLLAARHTHMEGWNQQTFEAYDDAPQEGSFDWGGLIGNVVAGLAVVGLVVLSLMTLGAAAPVIVGAIAVGATAVIGQGMSDYASGTVSSTETYIMTGFLGAVAGAVSGGVGAMIEGALPAGATALAKMGIVGSSGVLETLIENTIMGQRTTGTDMAFAFVASAGLFGIGDNLIPILNQLRRGGQAVGDMLGSAGRSIDNALNSAARSIDNALNSAARQAGDALDSISKELYDTFDDMFRKLDDIFPSPNRSRYAVATEGAPPEFLGQTNSYFDASTGGTYHADAKWASGTADIDTYPRNVGEVLSDQPKLHGYEASSIEIDKTDLDALRNKLGVPETDTIAIGKTNVQGLEGIVFEGQSPKVRREAGLPDLDEIWADRNIRSPSSNPQFTRHAEEVLVNAFDRAVIEAGIDPQDVVGVLRIHQSNPTGVCRKCIQGLANDNVPPGILKQLSLKYPNLRIEVTSEILPDVKVTGKSSFVIQNGKYI